MRLLLVEDDKKAARLVGRGLQEEGFVVDVGHSGEVGGELARLNHYDVIVLDWLLPGRDGLSVCREFRSRGILTPILMLTARDSLGDRVAGLNTGADDYLTKPFALEELLARVRALLRRSGDDGAGTDKLSFADLELDPGTREVTRGDERIELTRTEFSLLELFLRHPRQVLTRSVIFENVWGYDFGPRSNSLEVYMGYLRRKTESGGEARLLHTVRGVGYVLKEA
jgi:two-component system, OmpR family, response regulator MprA